MAVQRNWVTPVAAGAFLLSAVTGVLIFFHWDTGVNKQAHEWFSWALLGGVVLHVTSNFAGFKGHLGRRWAQVVIGLFAVILAASFLIPKPPKRPAPYVNTVAALAALPLADLAPLAHMDAAALRTMLEAEGLQVQSDKQSLGELAGADPAKRMRLLEKLFGAGKAGN